MPKGLRLGNPLFVDSADEIPPCAAESRLSLDAIRLGLRPRGGIQALVDAGLSASAAPGQVVDRARIQEYCRPAADGHEGVLSTVLEIHKNGMCASFGQFWVRKLSRNSWQEGEIHGGQNYHSPGSAPIKARSFS
jgi:hypothetical protein